MCKSGQRRTGFCLLTPRTGKGSHRGKDSHRGAKDALLLVAASIVACTCDSILESAERELEKAIHQLREKKALAAHAASSKAGASKVRLWLPVLKPIGPLLSYSRWRT
jgi:hypothetical protein